VHDAPFLGGYVSLEGENISCRESGAGCNPVGLGTDRCVVLRPRWMLAVVWDVGWQVGGKASRASRSVMGEKAVSKNQKNHVFVSTAV